MADKGDTMYDVVPTALPGVVSPGMLGKSYQIGRAHV